jgi:hypothetical protein
MKIRRRQLLQAGAFTAGVGIAHRLLGGLAQTHASDADERPFANEEDTSEMETWLLATAPADIAALVNETSAMQEKIFAPLISN